MEHDKQTTLISTKGDEAEEQKEDQFDQAPEASGSDEEGEQMLEDDDVIQRLSSFDKLGRAFVRALTLTVEDVGENDNHRKVLLEVAADCFSNIIRLSNTLTGCQGPVNSMFSSFVSMLAYKAGQIAQSIAQAENLQEENQEVIEKAEKAQAALLIKDILVVYSTQLEAWREASKCSKTYHQARALTLLPLKLRQSSKEHIQFDSKLVKEVSWLGNSVLCLKNAPKTQIMQKLAKQVYDLLIKCEAKQDVMQFLIDLEDSAFSTMLLGFLYADMPQDQALLEALCTRSNSVAFNDKCETALRDVSYFQSFYKQLDEPTLLSKVLPEAQVASRRKDIFIANIAFLAENLSFRMSAECAKQFVMEVISADDLAKRDPQIVRLLTAVCKGLDDGALEAAEGIFLRDFVLKAAQDAIADTTKSFENKMHYMEPVFICIGVFGARASSSFVDDAATTFLTLLFSDHSETTVPKAILDTFKTDRVSISVAVLDCIKSNAGRIQSATQANLIAQMDLSSCDQAWKDAVGDQVKRTLLGLSFQSMTNYSQMLALMYLLNSRLDKFVAIFNSEVQVSSWLTSGQSVISQVSFLTKGPSFCEVRNHLDLIGTLLYNDSVPLQKPQTRSLMKNLLDYATNEVYTFRGNLVYTAIERIASRASAETILSMMQALLVKQSEIYDHPVKKTIDEEGTKQLNSQLPRRLANCFKLMLEQLVKVESNLSYDNFVLILQTICHPVACSTKRQLKRGFAIIESLVTQDKVAELFETHIEQLIEQFVRRRTGVLSDNDKVRRIAKNVLVMVAWSGLIEKLLPQMVPIFDYKPIQMLYKMEQLLQQEFDKISHYDLMFYSEMSKDLMRLFSTRDQTSERIALRQPDQAQQEEEEKEAAAAAKATPVEEPKVQATFDKPVDITALLKAAKKKSKDKKKAKKGKGKATPAAAAAAVATTSAPAKKAEPEAPVMTKEERNKHDRQQLLGYVDRLRKMKSEHIATCQEILLWGNDCALAERLNYQDKTLNFTIDRLLKLLNLPASKFSSQFFLDNLLSSNPDLPFFKIKTPILTCLMAIAQNRLTIRTTQEFQNCLVFLDETANFSDMEGGYLKMSLTIANYVLKDPSVNLSVKEIGLQVTQSILDTNTEVEMIDIVRLTINMLKTNYISSNLGLFIRKLMQRCSRLEIAMLLQRLFEYQPVPRKTLLQELLNYDEPLFCPVWLQTQLWVLLSDEELSSLARKIWNKFGFYLQPEAVCLAREKEDSNMFHFMRSPNYSIFDLTVRASASAIELFQFKEQSQFVDDLIAFYDSEWRIIERLSLDACDEDIDKDQKVTMGLIADDRINRICIAHILKRVARIVKADDIQSVLGFLITKACLDHNQQVAQAAQEAAREIVLMQGVQHANTMLAILESFIKDDACQMDAKNQACILLAILAPFLEHTSAKKLQTTVEILFEISVKVKSEKVQQSICKAIPQLTRFMADKAKTYLMQQLTVLQETRDESVLKGTAYNVAGLFKAKGMKVLQDMNTIKFFGDSYFQTRKSDYVRKVAGLNLFEALSFSMGRSYELYLDIVFPQILGSISDQKEVVREAALNALKRIMANFSNYAIKQALPQFLAQLETDNWRSKVSTVEALGNMAYCAPKQISGFLPRIVKGLREVMNDTHEKVQQAAIQAISKIGSVIKCPEVGDMLEIIILALSNTTKHLNEALNLLLETSFVHKIDAPSLSLLVPLLDCGLMMHDNNSKQMAAQLMGNICSLTSNPSDLLPYMTILMPAIKNSLFDSIPEIRGSAAKAMGSLAKGLGIENSQEMLGWLRQHLNSQNTTTAERLGSAQGFAELISAHGKDYFEVNVEEVIIKAKDEDADVRDAYRSVLLFLATSYENFVEYLPNLVPLMIEGLADDKEEVRKVSMRNVKVCIKQFGKGSPNQLVSPILRMMFSKDSRVRSSSSILMYQLVKELENDIIKAQPKYLSIETKHSILSSMFILKFDEIEAVKTQAGQIWKSIVDSPLFILRQIIDTLIRQVFSIIQTPFQELQEMGLSCMRGLVEKFGEKLVNQALDIFEKLLDTATETNQTVGIARVMFNMVAASSHRLLQAISKRMIYIMEGNLSSDNLDIREVSCRVFITLMQRQNDKTFIDPVLEKSILYKLRAFVREGRQAEADLLLQSLKYMIARAKDLRLQDKLLRLCDISGKRDQPFSIAQAQVLGALAPFIASRVFHKRLYGAVMHSLEEELTAEVIDDEERIQHVLMAYAELMSQIPPDDFAGFLSEQLSKFQLEMRSVNRPGFYIDFISHFCEHTLCNIETESIFYLENVLIYMNHPEHKIIEKVIKAMNAIFKKVSKETQFAFVPRIRESIEQVCIQFVGKGSPLLGDPLEHRYHKKVPHLALLSYPAGVKCLVEVAQAAIMHGNIQVRTDAAYCFKYILDFAPSLGKGEIVKICGALIRVANDRFPQELKLQIYQALRYIQTKGGPAAKGFQVNMQTTYTKALADPQSTLATRRVVMDNLLLLVQSLARIDPIVKDLNALIDGTKIDGDQKTTVSECLALIIRVKGKAISSAISQTIYRTMTEIMNETNGSTNDRIFCNCATALAFLSAYASDPAQMNSLFNAFDETDNDAIMLPLKFAILINGNDTIDKTGLVEAFQAHLIERLADSAGFEEIDDDVRAINTEDGDDVFRFAGVLDTLAFMLDKFARRSLCLSPDSKYMKMLFNAINQNGLLKKLQQEDDISLASFKTLCGFASIYPVKPLNGSLTPECQETTRDVLACIQKFYLDHSQALQESQDALINILQLNYDNFTDYSDSVQIMPISKPMVSEAIAQSALEGVISDDMKMYAVDILFKKK